MEMVCKANYLYRYFANSPFRRSESNVFWVGTKIIERTFMLVASVGYSADIYM